MAYIRVVYREKRVNFDYVPRNLLDALISQDEISHFYRPSERRWVSIKFDPMRGNGGCYQGPERRRDKIEPTSEEQETENGFSNNKGYSTNWLQGLWQHIEGL
jgi:hypothetical protein